MNPAILLRRNYYTSTEAPPVSVLLACFVCRTHKPAGRIKPRHGYVCEQYAYMCVCVYVITFTLCVSEKSNLFLKDPTDLMTNIYGDTVVTTNGKHMHAQNKTEGVTKIRKQC